MTTTHPELLQAMVEGTREFGPTSHGGAEQIANLRIRYAREADPHATMPPSPRVEASRLPLLDKLGARLQFERTGVRLYEALISKLDAYGSFEGGPSRADLEHIRDEEKQHLALVQRLIQRIGGDPTAMTPSANLEATASRGVMDVLVDPRTTFRECLETIVIAELADHESWRALVRLTSKLDPNMSLEVARAEETEDQHLEKLRAWLSVG
jgi:rubrerythrin